ncbi:PrpF domain-containing protein [Actinacidiphila oryziradicis]|uniref:PrpF domain-containing protein n=1 Tax=Actinacidiphila oryziradicis TaxID=2571141 RepID=UPI00145FD182|nr:PrpF domain-containing protein [Actinacidiphila oryziradicis]
MTTLAVRRVRAIGVDIGLWSVGGAAAPTLVVASSRRLADPLPVLETAVATIGRPVEKVALAHPAADGPTAHAEYVFAQVVEQAGCQVLDLTPECGHSMLATATHLHASGRLPAGRGPLLLLTHRSGIWRIVECEIRTLDAEAGVYDAGLGFPLDDRGGDFPLGKVPLVLDIAGVALPVTVVDSGNPYAFVDASALGISSKDGLMTAGDDARTMLREVRTQLAPRLGLADSQVLPKPALLLHTEDGGMYVRALSADDWHPGLALTGLIAVATLVADIAPGYADLSVGHPGGTSTVRLCNQPDGTRVLTVTGRRVTRLAQFPLGV